MTRRARIPLAGLGVVGVLAVAAAAFWPADPMRAIAAELRAAAADAGNHAPYADLVRAELASADRRQVAVFSMPCFWSGEAHFGGLPGVYRTTPGYLGGKEVVRVEFDPEQTSADALQDAPDTAADKPGACRWDATRVARSRLDATFHPDDEFPAWYLRQTDGLKAVPMTPAQTARVGHLVHAGLPYEHLLSPQQRRLLARVRENLTADWPDYAGGDQVWHALRARR